jgi:hypothetical protein
VEEDEAGRLRNFRKRFGRGFDAEAVESEEGEEKVRIALEMRSWIERGNADP